MRSLTAIPFEAARRLGDRHRRTASTLRGLAGATAAAILASGLTVARAEMQPSGGQSQSSPAPLVAPPRAGEAAGGTAPAVEAAMPAPQLAWPKESVEADVAARSVAITSGFSGAQVIVFGTVENSRQETAEAGLYDVVVVIEGTPEPLTVRHKSQVAGIWVNTSSMQFKSVPGYYAIASTRPLDEIADKSILMQNGIGFDHVPMVSAEHSSDHLAATEVQKYRAAVVELKRRQELYFREDYGVAFIGKSLFRSTISLPGNIPVGPLTARVYLFRDGIELADFKSHVNLARAGIERTLYDFAFQRPVLYGFSAIFVAVAAGFAAAAVFNRSRG